MDNSNKTVSQIPVEKLWTDKENIDASRNGYLTSDEIKMLLRDSPVQFIVADIGHKLEWISLDSSFDFWKVEVKPHLADHFQNFENFPDSYAYVASAWTGAIASNLVILLEKYH